MNVKALQRIDRWFGVPLCFCLTLIRYLSGYDAENTRKPRSLLFVKMAEQGSTVLAYSALLRATRMVGPENVFFIAFEDNRFILDALKVIPKENVVTLSHHGFLRLARSGLAALRRLRALKLDAAVDLEFFSRGSAALTYLTGARQRAGFHAFFGAGPYRGNLMTHRLLYNPHLHTSETFLSLVEALERDPTVLPTFDWKPGTHLEDPPRFAAEAQEVAAMKELVRRETGGAPPLILLNSNASDLLPLRRWPDERYEDLARRLVARYPELVVAFTGSPAEVSAATELARRVGSPRAVSLAGKTSLRELLVLYGLSRVLVTNDSGPAHFAVLTPVRTVTLFGPETPALFAARTPRNTPLWAGISCSPCINAYNNRQSPCRDNRCMQALSVDLVFAEVCRAYEAAAVSGVLEPQRSGPAE